MKPKKIAFFSALLLLLLGFYYFYEIRWTARQKEKAEASKKVLNVDAEQVEQISLKKPDSVIMLEKKRRGVVLDRTYQNAGRYLGG